LAFWPRAGIGPANRYTSKVELTGLTLGAFVFVFAIALDAKAARAVADFADSGAIFVSITTDDRAAKPVFAKIGGRTIGVLHATDLGHDARVLVDLVVELAAAITCTDQ
jgi:hypothetical protein